MAEVALATNLPVSMLIPKKIQKNESMIAAMTEVFMTIILFTSISPNKCGTLGCKVDTSVSRSVMPLCMF